MSEEIPGNKPSEFSYLDSRRKSSREAVATYLAQGQIVWSDFIPAESVRGNIGETGALRVKVVGKTGEKFATVVPAPYSDLIFVAEQDLADRP